MKQFTGVPFYEYYNESIINEPVLVERYQLAFVNSGDPDQPVHPHSLIKTKFTKFTYYLHNFVRRLCYDGADWQYDLTLNCT